MRNFSSQPNTMRVGEFSVGFNMPKASLSRFSGGGDETVQGLPPYASRGVFPVDEYPRCPESWMRGSGTESSYFAPVKFEASDPYGAWFDFNANLDHPTHHVAVLISVQRVNPLTGRKVEGFVLEQYKHKCPVHDKSFGQDRFCSECKFAWPAQNYLAGNATQHPYFWLDGWRQPDGVVRQFIFTEEESRGIAAQLIGSERSFSLGFAFFRSRNPKPPKPAPTIRSYEAGGGGLKGFTFGAESMTLGGDAIRGGGFRDSISLSYAEPVRSKRIEIGAGARIKQNVFADPEPLDFWEATPAGILYFHYCDEATATQIIGAGKREERPDGFLDRLPTGNLGQSQ